MLQMLRSNPYHRIGVMPVREAAPLLLSTGTCRLGTRGGNGGEGCGWHSRCSPFASIGGSRHASTWFWRQRRDGVVVATLQCGRRSTRGFMVTCVGVGSVENWYLLVYHVVTFPKFECWVLCARFVWGWYCIQLLLGNISILIAGFAAPLRRWQIVY